MQKMLIKNGIRFIYNKQINVVVSVSAFYPKKKTPEKNKRILNRSSIFSIDIPIYTNAQKHLALLTESSVFSFYYLFAI
ncbi:hypothetical protein BpHYR1_053470 [Brachionus plicatilis]|uniref:Uncharacterized protein n=1 Tax=Brachionus plicatilis TaxID=10195 RepID=A0A3M7RTB4_BRAPC|nr:hypothetical protein BpHYR1_053470 [Brachionus plicatilis]